MNNTLTVEVSKQTYDAILARADAAGATPAQIAAVCLESQFHDSNGETASETQKAEARRRFESHFGAVQHDTPTGADNDQIDADLAREYADNHEAY